MSSRSPRHLNAGNWDLKGKKSLDFCPCCDPVYNHKDDILDDILEDIHQAEMTDGWDDYLYEDWSPECEEYWNDYHMDDLYKYGYCDEDVLGYIGFVEDDYEL